MKKPLLLLISLVLAASAHAGQPLVAEAPLSSVGVSSCTTIPNSAWTALTATAMSSRTGLFVTNPSTDTLYGNWTDSQATTLKPLLFPAGSSTWIGARNTLTLYLIAGGAGSQTACYSEGAQ